MHTNTGMLIIYVSTVLLSTNYKKKVLLEALRLVDIRTCHVSKLRSLTKEASSAMGKKDCPARTLLLVRRWCEIDSNGLMRTGEIKNTPTEDEVRCCHMLDISSVWYRRTVQLHPDCFTQHWGIAAGVLFPVPKILWRLIPGWLTVCKHFFVANTLDPESSMPYNGCMVADSGVRTDYNSAFHNSFCFIVLFKE